MDYELNEESEKINNIEDININLKDHQLAIIKKCEEIENNNICNFGIMSDKPGTGKTYAILGLIYYSKKKRNLIIVPQNIIKQWCDSIHTFSSGKLNYKKITDYSDILELYSSNCSLLDYDILLSSFNLYFF
jgi:superfamily II DNA or RNA helicase